VRALTLVVALGVLGLAACGGGTSKSEKASDQVCSARSDTSKQVTTLKGLTLSAASADQITKSLQAIGDDLTQIKNAQGDLKPDRKKQVQSANQAFEESVNAAAARHELSADVRQDRLWLSCAGSRRSRSCAQCG
jgi:hypothetical protein